MSIIAGTVTAAVVAIGVYILTADDGRADTCIGTTDPIQRGKMVNTCDHSISILACPRDATDGECVKHSARANATFDVRADTAVIAHACRAPHVAMMTEKSKRGCLSTE